MGDPVQESRCHLGIPKDGDPFDESEIGCDDEGCFFVELADEMEQQGTARGWERQIALLIEDDRVDLDELLGQISGFGLSFFPFQKIDQGVLPFLGSRKGKTF